MKLPQKFEKEKDESVKRMFKNFNLDYSKESPPTLEEIPTLNESIYNCLQDSFAKRAEEIFEAMSESHENGKLPLGDENFENQVINAQVMSY